MAASNDVQNLQKENQETLRLANEALKISKPLAQMIFGTYRVAASTTTALATGDLNQLYKNLKTTHEVISHGKDLYKAVKNLNDKLHIILKRKPLPAMTDEEMYKALKEYEIILGNDIKTLQNDEELTYRITEKGEKISFMDEYDIIDSDDERGSRDDIEFAVKEMNAIEVTTKTQETTPMMIKKAMFTAASYVKSSAKTVGNKSIEVVGLLPVVAEIIFFSGQIYEEIEAVNKEHDEKEGEKTLVNSAPNNSIAQDSIDEERFSTPRVH